MYVAQMLPNRSRNESDSVKFIVANNVQGASRADFIVLACPPSQAVAVLRADGMLGALEGKCLISMMGGVSVAEIERILYSDSKIKGLGSGPASRHQYCCLGWHLCHGHRRAVSLHTPRNTSSGERNPWMYWECRRS